MKQEKINRLQWILDDAVARGEIPGAILMVRKEGKDTVYLGSGYADIEAKKPVSRDSIYRLYSMSKPITATAVMILVERGLIDLADPVCRYLPGFCGQMVAAAILKQNNAYEKEYLIYPGAAFNICFLRQNGAPSLRRRE